MESPHLTDTGRVARYECDSNGHLNVQHYVRRILQASEAVFGRSPDGGVPYRDLHFRFHRELMAGSTTSVASTERNSTGVPGRVHVLSNFDGNMTSATAICAFEHLRDLDQVDKNSIPKDALPRFLPVVSYSPVDTAGLLQRGLAIQTDPMNLTSLECDETGVMSLHAMVGHFYRAAMKLWEFIGIDEDWFDDNDYGGIAMEMKLTLYGSLVRGSSFKIVSWVPRLDENGLDLANQLVVLPEGKPIARICASSMILDRANRRPVKMPANIVETYQQKLTVAMGDLAV